ncbi:MAG: anaerobic ribonucleoside-triphosphate reductase activating protein [Patescibacteria group bacterium]|jgi:pyruvate formate lyase activating enzyme
MKISGLQKTSLLDYPRKVSAIIFTQGCNFRCGYCHNPELLDATAPAAITVEEIWAFLKKRQKVLDAVVITGGEPTLQADLPEFIREVKKMGYLIKLDTNGTNPAMLKELIKYNLLDYIAMDIKASPEGYNRVTGVRAATTAIKASIKLIMQSGVDYEFRSTILPAWHSASEIKAMAELIRGAKRYYLQNFLNQGKLHDQKLVGERSFTNSELKKLATVAREFVQNCEVR